MADDLDLAPVPMKDRVWLDKLPVAPADRTKHRKNAQFTGLLNKCREAGHKVALEYWERPALAPVWRLAIENSDGTIDFAADSTNDLPRALSWITSACANEVRKWN